MKTEISTHGLKKPLCFVENKGQVKDQHDKARTDIQYKLSSPGMDMYVANGALHYQFKKIDITDAHSPKATTYCMDVALAGANSHTEVISSDQQAYYENYYTASSHAEIHARSYDKITYKNIYPNIDWVVYIKNNKVEYDFVVRVGGNVNDIKIIYGGATTLQIAKDGNLRACTPMGAVEEKAPYAYEQATGKAIAANFKLHNNTVTFETGKYNGALTIDPYLEWGTYFGGAGADVATGIKQTSAGIVYVSGYTASTGLATSVSPNTVYQSGNAGVTYDAFVAKYSATGVLQFATYFGGSANTQGTAVALDNAASPNVYLTGYTTSSGLASGFGIHQGFNRGGNDAFVAKFTATGILKWATYYGGANDDFANSIAIDGSNNVYIAGQTASTTRIATAGAYQTTLSGPNDAFVAKFGSSFGSLTWATYYGGTAQDQAFGVACDATGNVVITGQTNSVVNIATTGAYQSALNGTNDAFVAKFNSGGAISWATYFGGDSAEQANGVVCNPSTGAIAITGNTDSRTGVASTYAAQATYGGGVQDAFVANFTAAGGLSWSTYAGGPGLDYGQSICLDLFHNVVIAGGTYSTSGIATSGSYQTTNAGDYDAFVTKFTPYGQKLWGTYFGGSFYDYANSVTCYPTDQIIIAGYTTSTSGIATTGSAQDTNAGGSYDAFAAKFYTDTLVVLNQPFTDTLLCAGGTPGISYTANYNFQSDNIFTVELSDASGSFATPVTIGSVAATGSGTISCSIPSSDSGTGYRIRIVASDPSFTSPDDLYNIHITSSLSASTASANSPVCAGSTLYMYDIANYTTSAYNWAGPAGFTSMLQNPTMTSVTPANAGTYTVTTSHNGCPDNYATVSVSVNTFTPTTPADSVSGICIGGTIRLFANPDTAISGITYYWQGPAGFTSTMQNPTIDTATMANGGYYFLTDTLGNCPSATSYIYVPINSVTSASVTITATPGDTICHGEEITFTANNVDGGFDPGYQWMSGPGMPIVGAMSSTFSSLDLTNGATISCVLTSNVACPSAPSYMSNVITVTVLDNTPVVRIIASPETAGGSVTFTSVALNPGTMPVYEWEVNGIPATGTGVSTFTLAHIIARDTVTLILHTSMVCANPDSAVSNSIVEVNPAGVPLTSAIGNISLFPNPNKGSFTLKGKSFTSNSISIEITDPLGRTIYIDKAVISNNDLNKNIDLSAMPEGVYLLHLNDGEHVEAIRFSVVR